MYVYVCVYVHALKLAKSVYVSVGRSSIYVYQDCPHLCVGMYCVSVRKTVCVHTRV